MVESPSVLADTEVFDMTSAAVGDDFRIFVARCHAPDAAGVPVAYVTDANGTFGMTVDIVRYLQLGRLLPEPARRRDRLSRRRVPRRPAPAIARPDADAT